MATSLQLRRGNTAAVASTTGAVGELLVDTTTWALYLQDGVTPGGHLIGGGGTGLPAGSNTQVQYNNSGMFGASSNFTYNSATNTLTAGSIAIGPLYGQPVLTTNDSVNDLLIFPNSGNGTVGLQLGAASGAVTNESGGSVSIAAGNGFYGVGSNSSGGSITLIAGSASGTGTGGTIYLRTDNTGGEISINSGSYIDFQYSATSTKFQSDGKWNVSGYGTGSTGDVLTVDIYGKPKWETPATSGTVTSVTVNGTTGRITSSGSPITSSGTITVDLATTSVSAGSYTNASITVDAYGRLTAASNGTAPVTSVSGTAPISSSGGTTPTISISQASATTSGYLSSTDWNTFNNKGSGTVTSVTGTAPISSTGGATPAISISQANATTDGYLSSTDWTTFNSKGTGSVTSVAATGNDGITVSGSPITSSGTITLGLNAITPYSVSTTDGISVGGDLNVTGNTVISGNLSVAGTTTTGNSSVTNYINPVITLNAPSAGYITANSGADIGVVEQYYDPTGNANVVTGGSGNGTSATLNITGGPYPIGAIINIANVVPSGFNGTYIVTGSTSTSVTYLNATAGSVTTTGQLGTIVRQTEFPTTSGSSSSRTATINYSLSGLQAVTVGQTVTLTGITPSGYNGTYTVLTASVGTFTVQTTGSNIGPITVQGRIVVGNRFSFFGRADDTGDFEWYKVGAVSGNTFGGIYGNIKTGSFQAQQTGGISATDVGLGSHIRIPANTLYDNTTAASGSNALGAVANIGTVTLDSLNTGVIYTDAASLYIATAPTAGHNVTITNPYAIYVASGNSKFGGNITATGTIGAGNFSGSSSGTNTGDQTITLTGDVTGSGTGSFATTLANTSVSAGSYTYASITVDSKGRLTAASSGTAPVTSVSGTGVISSSGGTTPTISISQATTSTSGYLSSTDWNTFNNKGSGTVTSVSGTTGNISSTGGATPVLDLVTTAVSAGSYTYASLTVDSYGRLTAASSGTAPVTSVSGSGVISSSGGTTPTISISQATTSTSGYLSSTDWNTFNSKGSGTVTSVGGTGSVNGITLSGTVTSSGNLTLGGTLSGIGNSQLTNSSVTVNGTSIALGASGTVTAAAGTLTGTTLNSTVTGSSLTSVGTITSGYINPNVQGPTSVSGSTTINWAQKDVTKLTLTGSTAITNSGAVDGQKMILQLVQGGSGSYTVTFTSETTFGTSFITITLSTTVGKMDMIGLVYSSVNSKYNIVSFAAGY